MSRSLDIHAEHSVLASLMLWPEAYDLVAGIVRSQDFGNAGNRAIFEAISALILAGAAVDVITVHSKLQETAAEISLGELNAIAQSECTPRGARRYAEIVKGSSLERQFLASVDKATEIAIGEGELAQRLEQVVALFGGMAQRSVRKMPRRVDEIAMSRIDHYTALAEGSVPQAWRTRIPSLDRHLSGGLRPGKVYVIAARPKVGKTSLAGQVAQTIAMHEDLPTLILTQEMPDEELVDRGIANLGRIDYQALMTGKLTDSDWTALAEGVETISKLPLYLDDQGGLTLSDIRTKARSVKGLKLLVIDYLQLCSGSSSRRDPNRNAEIEEISRGVKALAKELGCAVLLLSQLNRKVEERQDKKPGLADLRDSGAIEQDADAIIFLWPVRTFDSPSHRLIGCSVAANRSGTTGEFGLDFEGRYQRWAESDQELRPATPPFVPRGRRGFPDGDED
jgi:replicative DNA helicase